MALLHSTRLYKLYHGSILLFHGLYFTLLDSIHNSSIYGSPSPNLTLHNSTMALLHTSRLYITLPLLYFTLLYSTSLYHDSTQLYLTIHNSTMTLLHSTKHYITLTLLYFTLLDSTWLYNGSTSLY